MIFHEIANGKEASVLGNPLQSDFDDRVGRRVLEIFVAEKKNDPLFVALTHRSDLSKSEKCCLLELL